MARMVATMCRTRPPFDDAPNDIEFSGERKRVRCNEGLGCTAGSSDTISQPDDKGQRTRTDDKHRCAEQGRNQPPLLCETDDACVSGDPSTALSRSRPFRPSEIADVREIGSPSEVRGSQFQRQRTGPHRRAIRKFSRLRALNARLPPRREAAIQLTADQEKVRGGINGSAVDPLHELCSLFSEASFNSFSGRK